MLTYHPNPWIIWFLTKFYQKFTSSFKTGTEVPTSVFWMITSLCWLVKVNLVAYFLIKKKPLLPYAFTYIVKISVKPWYYLNECRVPFSFSVNFKFYKRSLTMHVISKFYLIQQKPFYVWINSLLILFKRDSLRTSGNI